MDSVIYTTKDVWKNLKFQEFQNFLVAKASEMSKIVENCEISRQNLVEQMREFRKNANEDVRKNSSTLIKRFQKEVDILTDRCKVSEDALQFAFKKLLELPDPTLALNEAESLLNRVNKFKTLEVEYKRIRENMSSLEREKMNYDSLANENSQLKRRLLELEDQFDAQVASACSEKVKKVTKEQEERITELLSLQAEAETKKAELEFRVRNSQLVYDRVVKELNQYKLESAEKDRAKSDELKIISEDCERLRQNSLNQEKDLNKKLTEGCTSIPPELFVSLERLKIDLDESYVTISTKDSIINQLNESVSNLRSQMMNERSILESNLTQLESNLAQTTGELSNLKQELDGKKDYDQIKKDLQIFSQMELVIDSEQSEEIFNAENIPIEKKILLKNRLLQDRIAKISCEKDSLQAKLEMNSNQMKFFESELNTKNQLIAKLENDIKILSDSQMNPILAAQRSSEMEIPPFNLAQMHPGSPSNNSDLPIFDLPISNVTNEIKQDSTEISETQRSRRDSASSVNSFASWSYQATPTSIATSPNCTLCRVMQGQRNRLKILNQNLDQSNTDLRRQVYELQCEASSVRSDNVKLWERVRYLQSNYSATNSTQLDQEVASKYSSAYETDYLNPFSQFSRAERQRYYSRMRPHEKVMLFISRVISANDKARFLAFLYLAFLHIIVVLSLYHAASHGAPSLPSE